jgi:hypothetical protein
VTADGNCFFEAASMFISGPAEELRKSLCGHLEDNYCKYLPFMVTQIGEDENDTYLTFLYNIQGLRTPGKWSNNAAGWLST